MAFTPLTKVHLCNVPFDKLNNHSIRFLSTQNQFDYFASKIVMTLDNFTYQRRDNVIKANMNIDDLERVNYVFYQNKNYTDKWFYAFVTKMEYVADSVTAIYIETDPLQTWWFDLTFKQSFVVREHIATDTVGANVTTEGLNFGEYVLESPNFSNMSNIDEMCIIVASTIEYTTDNVFVNVVGGIVGGIYSGCALYFFDNDSDGAFMLNNFLLNLADAGKSDAIVYITTYPRHMAYQSGMVNGSRIRSDVITATTDHFVCPLKQSGAFTDVNMSTYTPRNKKLYVYPYNFLWGTNNQGGTIELQYELMYGGQVDLIVQGDVGANPTIVCMPVYYKGKVFNVDYGMTMKAYPQCSWNTDVYKNWVGGHLPSILIGGISALGTLGVGIGTANPVAIGMGALAVANQIGAMAEKSVVPPNYQGSNKGGSNVAWGLQNFEIFYAHIRNEQARKLDDYFDQFGYKTNELKTPNLSGRPYWNYVQLIDPNITGDIPSNDMEVIKGYFTRGITLWHTTTGFLDYSLNNH